MKLCVSNIAWPAETDAAAYELLREHGLELIELAPTRFWPDLAETPQQEVQSVMEELQAHGLRVAAFQALLFGKPELKIFDPASRGQAADYLKKGIDLASAMGAGALVFGSPKNRLRGEMTFEEACAQAADFFRPLGDYASRKNTCICMEPNPVEYGCDFLQKIDEAAAFVRQVDSPGVRLQFDTGGMCLAGDDAERAVAEHLELCGHFHISEPMLNDLSQPQVNHATIGAALRKSGYTGVISIEMKSSPRGLEAVSEAVRFVQERYQ